MPSSHNRIAPTVVSSLTRSSLKHSLARQRSARIGDVENREPLAGLGRLCLNASAAQGRFAGGVSRAKAATGFIRARPGSLTKTRCGLPVSRLLTYFPKSARAGAPPYKRAPATSSPVPPPPPPVSMDFSPGRRRLGLGWERLPR
jgi:hypothetical protein